MSKCSTIFADDLIKAVGGSDGATLCSKVWFFSEGKDGCEIQLSWLCDLLCISDERTLKGLIKRLVLLGFIEYEPRYGKGLAPIFKRGQKLYPYFEQKGAKNALKRVQKMPPKNNNKNNIVSTIAHTRVTDQQKERNNMYSFQSFWDGFAPRKEYQGERERCEAKWRYLSDEMRTAIINELRQGIKRKNRNGFYYKSPYLYLSDYTMQLPIWYNGTAEAGYAMDEAKKGGYALVAFRMPDRRIAYCKPQDVELVKKAGGLVL